MVGHLITYKFRILGLLAILAGGLTLPSAAMAGKNEVRSLNTDNVTAFIEKTSHMTTARGEFLSESDISAYLSKHLADDVKFTSTITYNLPNLPAQSTTISLDKAKFIDTVGEGTKAIEGYDNVIKVTNIKISWRKKQAFVNTENTETGFMAVPDENGNADESVPIEGRSSCSQVIDLNDGVIQISNAVCTTNIVFSE